MSRSVKVASVLVLAASGLGCGGVIPSSCPGVEACVSGGRDADRRATEAGGEAGRRHAREAAEFYARACEMGEGDACERALRYARAVGANAQVAGDVTPGQLERIKGYEALAEERQFAEARRVDTASAYVAFVERHPSGAHVAAARRRLVEVEFAPVAERALATRSQSVLVAYAKAGSAHALEWPVMQRIGLRDQPVEGLRELIAVLEKNKATYASGEHGGSAKYEAFVAEAREREVGQSYEKARLEAERAERRGELDGARRVVRGFRDDHPGSARDGDARVEEARLALLGAKGDGVDGHVTAERVDKIRAVAADYPGTPAATEATVLAERLKSQVADADVATREPEPVEAESEPPEGDVDEDKGEPPGEGYTWHPGEWEPADDGEWAWQPGAWRRVPAGLVLIGARYLVIDGKVVYVKSYWAPKGTVVVKPSGAVVVLRRGTKISVPSGASKGFRASGRSSTRGGSTRGGSSWGSSSGRSSGSSSRGGFGSRGGSGTRGGG